MQKTTINSASSLQSHIGKLREAFEIHKYLRASYSTGKDRTLDQNAVSHVWYEQLARELREDDTLGWKCFCKLNYGVPILCAEDDDFREFYDASIGKLLSYEQKLSAMKYLPVTRLMKVSQLSAYLKTMQEEFQKRDVRLEFQDEVTA